MRPASHGIVTRRRERRVGCGVLPRIFATLRTRPMERLTPSTDNDAVLPPVNLEPSEEDVLLDLSLIHI